MFERQVAHSFTVVAVGRIQLTITARTAHSYKFCTQKTCLYYYPSPVVMSAKCLAPLCRAQRRRLALQECNESTLYVIRYFLHRATHTYSYRLSYVCVQSMWKRLERAWLRLNASKSKSRAIKPKWTDWLAARSVRAYNSRYVIIAALCYLCTDVYVCVCVWVNPLIAWLIHTHLTHWLPAHVAAKDK